MLLEGKINLGKIVEFKKRVEYIGQIVRDLACGGCNAIKMLAGNMGRWVRYINPFKRLHCNKKIMLVK